MSAREDEISVPEHLNDDHDFSVFDSGVPALDEWVEEAGPRQRRERGLPHVRRHNRWTGRRYYALATGAVAARQATGKIRRNMPDPIPVMLLGRLAVDKAFQGKGLGAALQRDGVLCTRQAADIVGIRAMLVHAISPEAKRFYERYGFVASPIDPMTLMIRRVFLP